MSRDWELILTLRVHGSTGTFYGDGIAFWYVKEPDLLGRFNQAFGYKDSFIGLGVFLDTYSNNFRPHNVRINNISAYVWLLKMGLLLNSMLIPTYRPWSTMVR